MSVLGFELSAAVLQLEREGYLVITQEVRSKKGMPGNERRVVRETPINEKTVCLTYALFQTQILQERRDNNE